MILEDLLYKHFDYKSFRPGQRKIIEDVLSGNDVLAMLPTGGGKSICYLLPGYVLSGAILIVSPLLSLMEDQVHQLKAAGEKRVIGLNSFLSFKRKKESLEKLHVYKFIYASPEILQSVEVQKALKKIKVSLFVVDEAHCISQWGHEFRTDYLKLSAIRDLVGRPPCLALTATASEEVREDINRHLQLSNTILHIHTIDRPNIAISVEQMETIDDKIKKVIGLVEEMQGPGMIYFSTRSWAERMANHLQEKQVENVACYHGGMENEERILIQQQFIEGQLDVICCTSAFGMGVNKANIRYVIHFHYPTNIESYLQEIGRAGRDGENSIALLLFCKEDHELPVHLVQSELPEQSETEKTLQTMKLLQNQELVKDLDVFVQDQLGLSEIKWRFLKYQLEELGILNQSIIVDNWDKESAKQKIRYVVNKRLNHKREKLNQMYEWLLSDSCRRGQLLALFDEKISSKPIHCCDVCGINLNEYKNKQAQSLNRNFKGWEKELKRIFSVQ